MTTVAQLALRRRLLDASARRHRPRALPAAQPPHGLVVAYTSELLALSREMDAAIFAELRAERIVRADDDSPMTPLPSQVERLARVLSQRLGAIASRTSLVGMIDRIAARVGSFSGDEWRRQLRAAFGVDLVRDPNLAPLFERFRAENLALIRSLASDKVARVRDVLEQARGWRVEDLATQIRDATGATESRAALIARDQVLKLNSQTMEARHVAAGITSYTWSTSRDARVRPDHALLDGHVFAYANPPIVDHRSGRRANPGQDIQCRCVAIPKLPGID